jgi:hypothetical protein
MLIFLQANHCHAIDLGVLENTNKKELVLAVFLVDGEAAKPTEVLKQPKTPKPKTPKPKTPKPKTPKPQPIEPKTPQDSEPIEPKPPQDSEPIEPTPPKPRQCLRFQGACFFGD